MKLKKAITKTLSLLTKPEKARLLVSVFIQAVLSAADILGIVLMGALGSLGFNYLAGFELPNWLENFLILLHLEGLSISSLIFLTSVLIAFLFITKSILSLIISNKIFRFLALMRARVSSEMSKKSSNAPYVWIKKQDSQKIIFAITDGTNSLIIGFLGNLITILSELILLVFIIVTLLVINPIMTVLSVLLFGGIGLIVFKLSNSFAERMGRELSEASIASRNSLSSIFLGYKELHTLQKIELFQNKFLGSQQINSVASASAIWLQQLPKVSAEIGLVIGASALAAYQIWRNDASSGIGVLLVFLAASSRLLPSLMRTQAATLSVKNYMAASRIAFEVIEELDELEVVMPQQSQKNNQVPVRIELIGVNFSYSDGTSPALNNLNLQIEPGSIVAFAGSSGSGKTTLVDLLLGIYKPNSGDINITDHSGKLINPSIGYVPQSPYFFPGTIMENLTLFDSVDEIDNEHLNKVIADIQLESVILKLPNGFQTDIGQVGSRLSGGERQRLAIARALYPKPNLLIIDEGTSALDGQMESAITNILLNFRGEVTVVLIAHRLASIKNVDDIYYLSNGGILGHGTFQELQEILPEFKKQVSFMKLD